MAKINTEKTQKVKVTATWNPEAKSTIKIVKPRKPKFEFDITDLRAHNYVKCKVSNDAGIYQIIGIDGVNLKVMLDGARQGEWYTLDKIKPILLTKDILDKLQMDSVPEHFGEYIDTSSFVCLYRTYKNGLMDDLKISFDVEYVHQLQNIYSNVEKHSEILYTK